MIRLKQSDLLNKVAVEWLEKLTELKREVYLRTQLNERANKDILSLETALNEINVPLPTDWGACEPETSYED